MKIKNLYISIVISFIYVLIGTIDHLNGLPFQNWLISKCNNNSCELLIYFLYAHSYIGAFFAPFLGGYEGAYLSYNVSVIICQFIVFVIYTIFVWALIEVMMNIFRKRKK